jgi:phosphoglycerate dehydrogenase-like enzyme
VIGLNRSGKPCEAVETVYTEENLAEFLAAPDYLVLTLPDTPETRHFIDSGALAMMKPSAVLINVGRGSIVNENDLITALQRQQIRAAVLDVFETEPLPGDSLLWELPNAYVTPHVAAASFPQDVVEIFVENYGRFTNGEPLKYLIDFERGY